MTNATATQKTKRRDFRPIHVRRGDGIRFMQVKKLYRGFRICDAAEIVLDAWFSLTKEQQDAIALARRNKSPN